MGKNQEDYCNEKHDLDNLYFFFILPNLKLL